MRMPKPTYGLAWAIWVSGVAVVSAISANTSCNFFIISLLHQKFLLEFKHQDLCRLQDSGQVQKARSLNGMTHPRRKRLGNELQKSPASTLAALPPSCIIFT